MSSFEIIPAQENSGEEELKSPMGKILEKAGIAYETVTQPATVFSREKPVICVHVVDGTTFEQTRDAVRTALEGENLKVEEVFYPEEHVEIAKNKGWELPIRIRLGEGADVIMITVSDIQMPAGNEFSLAEGQYVTYK